MARAQTGIDFLVGMTVFLLAVSFVFGFVPGMFEPFAADTGAKMAVADRGAERLAEDLLVDDPASPGVLNGTCTAGFFDDGADPPGCRFDTDDLHAALGVESGTDLNATVENDGRIVHAKGPSPPDRADVTVARRLVRVDGADRELYVRVW